MFGSQLNATIGNDQIVLALLGDLASSVSAAGTNQATATLIAASTNIVTTVAAGTGVRLPVTPTVSAKDTISIANYGANTLNVYPPVGGKINNGSTNAAVTVSATNSIDLYCIDGTNYLCKTIPVTSGLWGP